MSASVALAGLLVPALAHAGPSGVFSLVAGDFEYEEPGVMEESGALYGVRGEGHLRGDWVRLRLDGELLVGGTEYEGQTWGGTPVETETGDRVVDLGLRLAGRVEPITPVLGIGYRHWEQDLRGPRGYRRAHHYLYAPVGLEIGRYDERRFWPLQLRVEYRHLISGRVESDLSDVDPAFEDAENDLDGGHGVQAELIATFRGGQQLWQLALFARSWDIDESEPEVVDLGGQLTEVFEPENETRLVGVRLGVGF
ncbi:hypothetical protein [Halorhodospira halophila]|uniref:hypothetical protein n=1 Tax=Halorhodospira halophila TaxID=1053 RepID=UPI0019139D08|nr:hypothetical protein [Halorhodospira halophila]